MVPDDGSTTRLNLGTPRSAARCVGLEDFGQDVKLAEERLQIRAAGLDHQARAIDSVLRSFLSRPPRLRPNRNDANQRDCSNGEGLGLIKTEAHA